MKFEGNGFSQLLNIMKETGYNKDVDVQIASVTSLSPLTFTLESSGIKIEPEDYVISQNLIEHKRTITISGGTGTSDTNTHKHTIKHPDNTETFTEDDSHSHTVSNIGFQSSTMTIHSSLSIGDRVFAISSNENQLFYIIDKAVKL